MKYIKALVLIFLGGLGLCMLLAFFLMNSNITGSYSSWKSRIDNEVSYVSKPMSIEQFIRKIIEPDSPEDPNVPVEPKNEPKDPSPKNMEPDDPNGHSIYIDPGHGGYMAGSTDYSTYTTYGGAFTVGVNAGKLTECANNYEIALILKRKLEAKGYTTKMSRDSAALTGAIGNSARGKEASNYDFYVCIHSNGGGGPGYFLIHKDDSKIYDPKAWEAFKTSMSSKGRTIWKGTGLYKKSCACMSAFLKSGVHTQQDIFYIEVGAHDELVDADYISSAQGREEIADAFVAAVDAHFS